MNLVLIKDSKNKEQLTLQPNDNYFFIAEKRQFILGSSFSINIYNWLHLFE